MSQTMVWMLAGLLGEVLLLAFVALFVSWLRNRSARRRDMKAVRALVEKVKKGKADREALIGRFLNERMGLTGEVLDEARVTMLRAELSLLQRFAHVYGKRDPAAASRFDVELEAAIQPYHALSIAGEIQSAGQEVADEGELERLRRDNTRLAEELRITMETMSRMLNEYSAMFSPDSAAMLAPIAAAVGGATAAAAVASGAAEEPPAEEQPAGEGIPAEANASGEDTITAEDAAVPATAAEVAADSEAQDAFDIDLVSTSTDPEELPDAGQVEVSDSADETLFEAETDQPEPVQDAAGDDSDVVVASQAGEDDLSEVADLLAEVDAAGEAVPAGQEPGMVEDGEALFGGTHAETDGGDDVVELDRGEDLDVHSEMLEEDAVEVVGFDGPDDIDLDEEDQDSVEDLFDALGEEVDAIAGEGGQEPPAVRQEA